MDRMYSPVKSCREFLQDLIADIVAVAVIDRLEVVDVDHQYGEMDLPRFAASSISVPRWVLHVTAVVEPCQRIRHRHLNAVLNVLAQAFPCSASRLSCVKHPRQQLVLVNRAHEIVVHAHVEPAQETRVVVRLDDDQDRQV